MAIRPGYNSLLVRLSHSSSATGSIAMILKSIVRDMDRNPADLKELLAPIFTAFRADTLGVPCELVQQLFSKFNPSCDYSALVNTRFSVHPEDISHTIELPAVDNSAADNSAAPALTADAGLAHLTDPALGDAIWFIGRHQSSSDDFRELLAGKEEGKRNEDGMAPKRDRKYWFEEENIFLLDWLIIPWFWTSNWILVGLDFKQCHIYVYDSQRKRGGKTRAKAATGLGVPQQGETVHCAVYTIWFAKQLILGNTDIASWSFSIANSQVERVVIANQLSVAIHADTQEHNVGGYAVAQEYLNKANPTVLPKRMGKAWPAFIREITDSHAIVDWFTGIYDKCPEYFPPGYTLDRLPSSDGSMAIAGWTDYMNMTYSWDQLARIEWPAQLRKAPMFFPSPLHPHQQALVDTLQPLVSVIAGIYGQPKDRAPTDVFTWIDNRFSRSSAPEHFYRQLLGAAPGQEPFCAAEEAYFTSLGSQIQQMDPSSNEPGWSCRPGLMGPHEPCLQLQPLPITWVLICQPLRNVWRLAGFIAHLAHTSVFSKHIPMLSENGTSELPGTCCCFSYQEVYRTSLKKFCGDLAGGGTGGVTELFVCGGTGGITEPFPQAALHYTSIFTLDRHGTHIAHSNPVIPEQSRKIEHSVWMLLGKMKNTSGQAFLITLGELLIDVPHSFGKTIYEVQRTMDYIGHEVSHSMNAVNSRCAKDGLKFRQPPAKLPTEPPADDGFHLCILSLANWQKMTSIARAQLFGTGHDLYILGMTTANWQRENVADKLRRLHRSDAPVEVQVQGLRQSSAADVEYDYTTTIRTTTLETVLENAQNPDGLVLNALQLPSGHMVHSNPLIDSGLYLEYMAYRHTNGLPGFVRRYPTYSELHWQLFGTVHTLSIVHFDVAAKWVFVEGPGEKFWVRGRSRDRGSMADQGVDTRFHDLQDSFAFEDWEPDDANLQGCEYEGVVIRNHLVIGAPPVLSGPSELNTGGHFFCARTMHSAMCILLHLVMLQHILTNADHIGLWEVFVHITAFWLNVTCEGKAEELRVLEAYLPDLMGPAASGWIEIIYLASIVELLPALDLRHYNNAPAKDEERQEREETQ
ncbi:hypothetical protein C8R44DRAFT_728691 [Mycena epipterygia]|nr:hypothetical protein C8R44DRAFT_728691 [Mycena epipterygia]